MREEERSSGFLSLFDLRCLVWLCLCSDSAVLLYSSPAPKMTSQFRACTGQPKGAQVRAISCDHATTLALIMDRTFGRAGFFVRPTGTIASLFNL